MTEQSLYKSVLLDHFHNPRNRGELGNMRVVKRGSNPRCGDEIEVGINYDNDSLAAVRFRGRGCSICLASASMMTESTQGITTTAARELIGKMQAWIDDNGDLAAPAEAVAALAAVKQHPARRKCVMLAWQALDESLDEIESAQAADNG